MDYNSHFTIYTVRLYPPQENDTFEPILKAMDFGRNYKGALPTRERCSLLCPVAKTTWTVLSRANSPLRIKDVNIVCFFRVLVD